MIFKLIMILALIVSVDARRGAASRRAAREKAAALAAKRAPYENSYKKAVQENFAEAKKICTKFNIVDPNMPPVMSYWEVYCSDVLTAVELGTNTAELVKKLNYGYGITYNGNLQKFKNMTVPEQNEVFCRCAAREKVSGWSAIWLSIFPSAKLVEGENGQWVTTF
jgi:hypothetical protein